MRTLTFSLLLVVIVATFGLGWLFDRAYEQYIEMSADNTADVKSTDVVSSLQNIGIGLATTLSRIEDRTAFLESWPTNSQFTLSLESLTDFPMPQALLDKLKSGEPLLLETKSHLAFHFYLANSQELLVLKSPLLDAKQAVIKQNYVFTILFYAALILLFLLWSFPLVRQLLALRKSAKLFGDGELNHRISLGRISYIRDIEVEFNHMAQRIENLVADVKLLSNAVSHDLRTPLAKIRFGIDTLQEEEEPETRRRFEQKISDNVDEMTSLVETLLSYARLDQAMLEVKKDQVELSQLIEKCIASQTTDSVELEMVKTGKAYLVKGDSAYLMIMVNNLLQNAIHYGGGRVLIQLYDEADYVQVCISDNGDGISPEHYENILKPFVRGKEHKIQKGYGMGLAIVKRILDWHQGTIQIDKSPELSGAKFSITLPRFSSS
ncbi:sensor histidine kinase [Aliikangiella coralliicola]|uniref:histidine kinase n=1 Tax=Aliikangiella coralliicola TaxID=2592383 RepID=A0A545UIT3_9GAMM|nr:ATP-binding protein [Aliikangiella coralliicola]TQV89381.1 two-component sensor histidine kinase [Aliikangiella coralliicola]